ncbi:MAG: formate/nitrite transporter family protein [Pseudobutyrivibrio sp.]|nr:formate/nitrite transporter family protein [Pseudobutyrivibrio sp.]
MRENIKKFVLAIMSGIAISFGGTIYLSLDNKIIGSLMFTIGLYIIVLNGFYLFTGKVGYLVNEKPKYLITLLITWLGNLVGTFVGARAILATRISGISQIAASMSEAKCQQSLASAFVLAIFCGVLMFVAVDGYKQTGNPIILFLCVSVFILCGFEHCIANMFYFSLGNAWSVTAAEYLLIMTLGNAVGGCLIPLTKRL